MRNNCGDLRVGALNVSNVFVTGPKKMGGNGRRIGQRRPREVGIDGLGYLLTEDPSQQSYEGESGTEN